MKYRVVYFALGLLVLGTVSTAQAQVKAKGQARGSFASLISNVVGLLDGTNTGPQEAVEPGNFNVSVDEDALGIPGVLEVVSGATSTIGIANGLNSSVTSVVGETTADVLDGTVEVLRTSALADVDCNAITAGATVELASVGEGIEVPLNPQPNTTINVAGLATVTLNRQVITIDPITRSIEARVDAVVIQLLDGSLLEIILGTAFARLENLPAGCPVIDGPGGPPPTGGSNLNTSTKTASFLSDGITPNFADPGDRILFNIRAANTGTATAPNVVIIDRLPRFTTFNSTSVLLNGAPVTTTATNCPGGVSFNGCAGEQADDPGRQCFSVNIGDLTAQEVNNLTFEVTVTQNVGNNICNTARVANQQVTAIVPARPLNTSGGGGKGGGGGCTLNPSAASGEAWPVFLVALLWMLHRRRRMLIH